MPLAVAMSRPPVLIPHAPGTNRDEEASLAVAAAGGEPRIVAVNDLKERPAAFSECGAVLLPGGFSYGDALGAGGRLALELRAWFGDELREVARSGRPILGICNGFQALVKSGLLGAPGPRSFTLAANAGGRFECRWVTLRVEPDCRSGWLEPLRGSVIRCPVAHGEGTVGGDRSRGGDRTGDCRGASPSATWPRAPRAVQPAPREGSTRPTPTDRSTTSPGCATGAVPSLG